MSKVKSQEKRELELREQRASTEKAEIELQRERIYLKKQKADYRRITKSDPERYGRFKFNADVNHGNVEIFTDALERWARVHPGKAITVILNSPGGGVFSGLSLYDTLRTLSSQGHHITTVVRGYAASMGGILLQAGDTRLVGAESHLMIHEMASGTAGKVHKMKDDLKFDEQLNRRLMGILAARTNGKWDADALYERIEAKDWWLSAEEAVAEGFADGIG